MQRARFAPIFIAIFIGTALIIAALLLNARRPKIETEQPTAQLVKASGKCAQCHMRETPAIVIEYESSQHMAKGVNCLDCHQPAENQETFEHNGFVLAKHLTSKNCATCHATEHDQFMRSRHAAAAWAAVRGSQDFTPEQIAEGEKYHKGAVDRPGNALAVIEGDSAMQNGCISCHAIGRPNADGSIGSCTQCHSRHAASVELARQPETCGQCHVGPDHSQIEIYKESKHGVIFAAQKDTFNLKAHPKDLTTKDMPVPTCATCHMSGLNGQHMTHDTTERLSWYLFAAVSKKRPGYLEGQTHMKELCLNCHTKPKVDEYYTAAETVVQDVNKKTTAAADLIAGLRKDGLLTPEPFDEKIEFDAFDYWHYHGRTAKHGAFMGGADFVQWHGNYELSRAMIELKDEADAIRKRGKP